MDAVSTDRSAARNWFDQGGGAYARFRPEYPPELSAFLATLGDTAGMAVDVGCGNGQLTVQLAEHFDAVVGLDPSEDQIRNATPRPNVRYICAPAEQLPLPDGCADLITAAQAAHWFDLPAFYAEVRRVARPRAAIALITYGVMQLDAAIDARFQQFYGAEVGPFWPPERKLVDSGYAGIAFPFEEQQAPRFEIRRDWRLDELLGYVSTWSAVRRVKEAGREDILDHFACDAQTLWGDAQHRRAVVWPISIRLGAT
jgi:SAM-dependent methyltransferase